MTNTSKLLLSLILIIIAIIFFYQRWIFFYKYEPEFQENLYYHSQWIYPNSTRGISDGELYKFVGYRLVQGENPFNVDYEVPPFGKYLYGLGEMYLGNPYLVNLFLYLSSVFILYLLSLTLIKNQNVALLILLLFVSTPFVATQIAGTMLDLPLMFLILMHTFLFIKFLASHKVKHLLLAGIFLGLATATKFGVYTPLIVLFGLPLVFTSSKKIIDVTVYCVSVLFGYWLAFFPVYFIRHPNPLPWLRLHEKVLQFYSETGNDVIFLNQWKTIFFNIYQGVWGNNPIFSANDWSILLPAGTISLFLILVWAVKQRDRYWIYICLVGLAFLIVNTLIPFYPRYLMSTIPLFALLIGFLLKRAPFLIFILSLINFLFLIPTFTPPDVNGDAQVMARFISTRAYREIYRSMSSEQRKTIPERDFIKTYENFLEKIGTRFIEIKAEETFQSSSEANFKYNIRYLTKYGEIIHEPTFHFIKVNNQWKLDWNWEYLWPGFTPESKIVVSEKTILLLRIDNEKDQIVATRGKWKTVYVIPRIMFDWGKHLNLLSVLTGEPTEEVDKKIRSTIPDHYPRFVGYLDPKLGEEGINKALSTPGVTLQDTDYLIISDTKSGIPTERASALIREVHKKNPELFYVHADIYLEKNVNERILIPFKYIDQKDVIIKI